MIDRTRHLLEEVLALPEDERNAFLDQLREKLDVDDGGVDWTPELEKRAREAVDGTDPGRPVDEVLDEISASLRRRSA